MNAPAILRALCCLALAAAGAGAQSTLLVPQQFESIQAAVDAADEGDTIQIAGGTYAEAVVLSGKAGLTLKAKGKVVIDPGTDVGLTLEGCSQVLLLKLRVLGATTGIHLVDSTGCLLSKCRVENTSGDGIRADGGGGHRIEKCQVKKAGNDGIALGVGEPTPVDDCTIVSCKLTQPGDDGIDINGSGNLVQKCTALKPLEDGFEIDDATVGTGNSFEDCKAIKPAFGGLVITGVDNAFVRCKVVQSGDDAVTVGSGSGAVVQDCKLTKPGFDGIRMAAAASQATLSGNKVSGAGDDGLDLRGTASSVDGNSAKGCQGAGFRLAAGSSGNTLTDNTAKGNQDFDLNDASGGANSVDASNHFGTTGP